MATASLNLAMACSCYPPLLNWMPSSNVFVIAAFLACTSLAAEALVALHEDAALWDRVRTEGGRRIAADCDAGAFATAIRALCEAQVVA